MNPRSEERMAALAAELNGESARAAAIVGAAWVEEELQQAIESVLHQHDEAREKLFTGMGGLAAFEAKIELGCLFGFMTDAIRSDLHAIRRTRNDFAHQIVEKKTQAKLSFETDSIRQRSLALRCVKHLKLTDARAAFIQACVLLNEDFHNIAFMSRKVPDENGKVPDCGQVFAEGAEPPIPGRIVWRGQAASSPLPDSTPPG